MLENVASVRLRPATAGTLEARTRVVPRPALAKDGGLGSAAAPRNRWPHLREHWAVANPTPDADPTLANFGLGSCVTSAA